jgi:hypothetical protein
MGKLMTAPDSTDSAGTGSAEIDALIDAYRNAVAKYWNPPIGDPPEPRTIPTAGETRAALISAIARLVQQRDGSLAVLKRIASWDYRCNRSPESAEAGIYLAAIARASEWGQK